MFYSLWKINHYSIKANLRITKFFIVGSSNVKVKITIRGVQEVVGAETKMAERLADAVTRPTAREARKLGLGVSQPPPVYRRLREYFTGPSSYCLEYKTPVRSADDEAMPFADLA